MGVNTKANAVRQEMCELGYICVIGDIDLRKEIDSPDYKSTRIWKVHASFVIGINMGKWAEENNITIITCCSIETDDIVKFEAWFDNEEDAVAFKLRWL